MKKIEQVKRIYQLKRERKDILKQIEKWDAMPSHQKALNFNMKEVMRLYHKLESNDTMLEYAKKGIYYQTQRIYFSDLF